MVPEMRDAVAAIRFGFGLSPIRRAPDYQALLDGLAGEDTMPARFPFADQAAAADLARRYRETHKAERAKQPGAKAAHEANRDEMSAVTGRMQRGLVARSLDSAVPLRERLVLFWADHFTARPKAHGTEAFVGPYLDHVLRARMTGRFADMLKAVATHPLMLSYLDQIGSIGPNSPLGRERGKGLNENLARELLELHSLGVDAGYDQTDVRELAELLTGLHYSPTKGFLFKPAWAEPGAETVLGRSYGGGKARLADIYAALDDIAAHPDTARHMAGKLARHFVADTLDQALVDHLAAIWRATDGDLMAVYAGLMEHPAARAPLGGKVRRPLDFIIASLTALGVRGDAVMALERRPWRQRIYTPVARMGQRLLKPPGPDGWPEEASAWVNPPGLASRIRWAMDVPGRFVDPLPDPRDFVQVALGPVASARLDWAASAAETRAQGVGLVLASPEFNRR